MNRTQRYGRYLQLIRGKLRPLPGVVAFVAEARKSGLRLAVATSADRVKLEGNLREIGLPAAAFDATVNGLEVERKKPAPDIFLEACRRLLVEAGADWTAKDLSDVPPTVLGEARTSGLMRLFASVRGLCAICGIIYLVTGSCSGGVGDGSGAGTSNPVIASAQKKTNVTDDKGDGLGYKNPKSNAVMETIGIYNCYGGLPPDAIPFVQACGFNTYQRWDLGWMRGPAKHAAYYREMAEDVTHMQAARFRVYVLLTINMRQRQDNEPEGYSDNGLDPNDEAAMKTRLDYIVATVRHTKHADGFTIFAGDPGGHKNAQPRHAFEWTRRVAELVRREAPTAEINVNTWGIAAWDSFTSPFDVAFWDQEVRLTRELLAQPDVVGPGLGMEFPLHNYYRSLARSCYTKAGREPVLFPTRDEVQTLRARGAKRLWGWPYFVTDECNDGYPGGLPGVAQAETRYIRQVIAAGWDLGLDGMIANAMAENVFAECLNLYAFARFCRDAKATPELVILDFASQIAEPASAPLFADVLRYIENQSTWQAGQPVSYRLPNFETGAIHKPQDALAALDRVTLRQTNGLPLPRPAAEYLDKLRARVRTLAAGR